MLTYLALGAAVGTVGYLLLSIVRITGRCLKAIDEVLKEFRLENQMLGLQKQIVSEINHQISLQRVIIDKQLTMAMNTVKVMQMMRDKEKDPEWMDRFHQGRDNAKNN